MKPNSHHSTKTTNRKTIQSFRWSKRRWWNIFLFFNEFGYLQILCIWPKAFGSFSDMNLVSLQPTICLVMLRVTIQMLICQIQGHRFQHIRVHQDSQWHQLDQDEFQGKPIRLKKSVLNHTLKYSSSMTSFVIAEHK